MDYIKSIAYKIFGCDSPTGYSKNINNVIVGLLAELGYEANITNKGNVRLFIEVVNHS